jgi:hypothetical protein
MNFNFLRSIHDGLDNCWGWITSGQNATALGILVAVVINTATIYVLVRTLRAVNKQAIAADRQAEAAEAQANAARLQTEVFEKQKIAAERAAIAAEKQAQAGEYASAVAEAQRIATERAAEAARIQSELTRHDILAKLRPVLVVTRRQHPTPGYGDLPYLENHGSGVAIDVKVSPRRGNSNRKIPIEHNILGPSQAALIKIENPVFRAEGIQAFYDSQDGRHFVTIAEPNENDLVQNTFEIDSKGGWLAQDEIPEKS